MTGAASRDYLEVGELELERDGAAANPGALAITPNLVDDLLKRIPRGLVGEEIGEKRVLGPNGFAYPVSANRPLVDAARGPIIVGAHLPKMLLQEHLGLCP